ncbi:MAG: TetR/AcrR family transcriptional regulator [Evtepia sp.]|uniref:TetR/AcrR family transcriptional regulator n=1 Tax=Evtepia sp. TaxID=2773933 RepID=UPI002A7634D8|nr:TetR/AcrR family transcriptional regulator [Evtepia sp.]MDY3014371.1 TetR/AcrR family transcriptional regulator [Evtepia sp.]
MQKTIEAVYRSFEQLLCEKEYEKITVTELCALAVINKKAFYVYYTDLNELLAEMQGQLSRAYAQRVAAYQLPRDAKQVIREFFLFSAEQGEAYERITCSETFQYIRGQMIRNVQEETKIDPFTSTLLGVLMSTALLEIYKYWVMSGKKQSIEEDIATATSLICAGLVGTL